MATRRSPLKGVKGILQTLQKAVAGHQTQPDDVHLAVLTPEQAAILLGFIGWELEQWASVAVVLRLPPEAEPGDVRESAKKLVNAYERNLATLRDFCERFGIEVTVESTEPGKVM